MEREKNIKRSVSFTPNTLQALDTLAAKQHITTTELIRNFVERGLSISGYRQDIDLIADIVREEIRAVYQVGEIERIVKNETERTIKMLMKIGKANGGQLFLLLNVLMYVWDNGSIDDLEAFLNHAMKSGVAYMQMKDFDVNAFLENSRALLEHAERMTKDLE